MNLAHERAVLRQMTAELDEYLRSEVVLWPLAGSGGGARLSLGRYLLTGRRLQAVQDPDLPALAALGDEVLGRWPALAERKALAELPMRLNLWSKYLAEGQGRYATEVAQRVMIALLWARFPALAEAGGSLPVEAGLRAQAAVPFVWDPELEPAFPEPDFWMLRRSR